MNPPIKTATRLGHYTIIRKVGEGAMGSVFEAIQDGLNRRVALKVLSERLVKDPTYLERFRREAEAAAALNHPNIVTVYEIGQEQGAHYFTMQFVDGESLQERLDRSGKLTVSEALSAVAEVAEALDYAWNHGRIIHRDIKPDNIMITKEGNILVADLGLAKSLQEEARITMTGVPIGSPAYMAPEQAESAKDADCRADIYSLGITLHYLLTGQLPFQGPTALAVILAHGKQPLPDPRVLTPEVSESVCALLQRMCAKDPAQRPQTPAELLRDLEKLGVGPSFHRQPTLPAPTRVRRASDEPQPRNRIFLAAAAAVLLLAAGLYLTLGWLPRNTGGPANPGGQDSPGDTLDPPSGQTSNTGSTGVGTDAASTSKLSEARLKDLFDEALEFAKSHEGQFDTSTRNFKDVEEEARGTKYAMKARNERERLERLWAQDSFKKLQAKTDELCKADRFGEALKAIAEFPSPAISRLDPERFAEFAKSAEKRARDRYEALDAEAKSFIEKEDFQSPRELYQQATRFGVPDIQEAANAKLVEIDGLEAAVTARNEASTAYDALFWEQIAPLVNQRKHDMALQKLDEVSAGEQFKPLGPDTFDWYKAMITPSQELVSAAAAAASALVDKPFSFQDRQGQARTGIVKKIKGAETILFLDDSGEISLLLDEMSGLELVNLTRQALSAKDDNGYSSLVFFWLYEDKSQGPAILAEAKDAGVDLSGYEYLFADVMPAPAPETTPAPEGQPTEVAPPPENRPFYMGFSTFPYAITPEAVEDAYQTIQHHADLVSHALDNGIPWPEAFEKKNYRTPVEDDLNHRMQRLKKDKKLYLALSPVNPGAETPGKVLADYWGDNEHMERPGKWLGKNLDDPEVLAAYTNYCQDLIQRFQPDYMAYALQANELKAKYPSLWPKFLTLAKNVYAGLKAKHPQLPVFVTLHAEAFWLDPEVQARAISEILPYTDFIAVSSYGGVLTTYPQPDQLPNDFFGRIASLAPDKPFAVAETAYIAENLEVFGWNIAGSDQWQKDYLEFLLRQSHQLHAVFIVWSFPRDYDPLWEQVDAASPLKEFLKIYRDTGLWDGNGNPRPALETWDTWHHLPKQ